MYMLEWVGGGGAGKMLYGADVSLCVYVSVCVKVRLISAPLL